MWFRFYCYYVGITWSQIYDFDVCGLCLPVKHTQKDSDWLPVDSSDVDRSNPCLFLFKKDVFNKYKPNLIINNPIVQPRSVPKLKRVILFSFLDTQKRLNSFPCFAMLRQTNLYKYHCILFVDIYTCLYN